MKKTYVSVETVGIVSKSILISWVLARLTKFSDWFDWIDEDWGRTFSDVSNEVGRA
jgi:hypothetical protein